MTKISCNTFNTIECNGNNEDYELFFSMPGFICIKNDTDKEIKIADGFEPGSLNLQSGDAYNNLPVTGIIKLNVSGTGYISFVYRR